MVLLPHVSLSQAVVCLHRYKTDYLNNTVLQPSMPKLPLYLGLGRGFKAPLKALLRRLKSHQVGLGRGCSSKRAP